MTYHDMTLAEIKKRLRAGPYAWPGGYPYYFIASDGEALSFDAVRAEWRQVVWSHLYNMRRDQWYVIACEINYENPELYCAHTNERIQSAYAEPDNEES